LNILVTDDGGTLACVGKLVGEKRTNNAGVVAGL